MIIAGASYPRECLVGKQFGRLRVLYFVGRKSGKGYAFWRCLCECGKETIVTGDNLKCGRSRSCGCQIRVGLRQSNLKHGKTGSPEYKVWAGMHSRCYNPKEKAYKYYGERGIKICRRWRGKVGFENFLADMGERPSLKHWIERKRNWQGYSPSNCCWATRQEQMNNKRNTVWVLCRGKRIVLKSACEMLGLNYGSIKSRMYKGMTFSQAVSRPFRQYSRGRMVSKEAGRG
jgi:hypothetical protein